MTLYYLLIFNPMVKGIIMCIFIFNDLFCWCLILSLVLGLFVILYYITKIISCSFGLVATVAPNIYIWRNASSLLRLCSLEWTRLGIHYPLSIGYIALYSLLGHAIYWFEPFKDALGWRRPTCYLISTPLPEGTARYSSALKKNTLKYDIKFLRFTLNPNIQKFPVLFRPLDTFQDTHNALGYCPVLQQIYLLRSRFHFSIYGCPSHASVACVCTRPRLPSCAPASMYALGL